MSEEPRLFVTHLTMDGTLTDPYSANDGSFVGADAPTFGEGYDCALPGAVELDGEDDYVVLAHTQNMPIVTKSAFTVAMWVNGPPQMDLRVFAEGSSSSNSPVFTIGSDNTGSTGRLDMYIRDASGTAHLSHFKSQG